ncbi:DUF2911 domain-containing protein [Roseivirga sp. E12]|uniref:DUF2911 domain-containing protein n=1 Tax=Roseivirga sp. E12 TaxID=2819237 RepID=UPI001ABC0D65|nr:DUF2911 domain-containing protein [Roseivirga sp. E12]MBO3697344.1 DUF2911 domain-containing protein [Roseivirga sp. E12]
MKKTLTLIASMALLVFFQSSAMAQRGPAGSPRATVKQQIGNTNVEIDYGRPSLAGRDVNKLVRNNRGSEVWRTGANTSTSITFDKDVTFAGQALKAGSYSLWTIPSDGEWTVVVNSVTGNWGTEYGKKTPKDSDVLRAKVPVTTANTSVETFTINISDFDNKSKDKANLELAWGNLSVKIPIVVKN